MTTPRNAEASSPDDDPTGVRALLSSLPEPEPMPAYLVDRIGASLAAEQARRAALSSGPSVSPLIARTRRRPGRLLFAFAGTAAAVVLIGVVGSNLRQATQPAGATDSAAAAITSGREADSAAPPSANDSAGAGKSSTTPVIEVRLSETRYTATGFVSQAGSLRSATLNQVQSDKAYSAAGGVMGTQAGLAECIDAIGAGRAQTVRADLALYEGQPAVIIVATTDGSPTAYAVGRQCSKTNSALLRPATPLP